MLAEVKAELTYRAIRFCVENPVFGPKVDLGMEEGATLDEARKADHTERDFAKSARLYYSVLNRSDSIDERIWAFGGLVLQLANARAFRQARELLHGELFQDLYASLPEDERYFFKADAREKEGRVEFTERGYKAAFKCFSDVIGILEMKGSRRWSLKEQLAVSTANHFLGKIRNEEAERGINREENLRFAPVRLWTAIKMDAQIRKEGTGETLGYDYLELARTYLIAGDFIKSDRFVEEARRHFEAYVQTTPTSNVLEKYLFLREKIDSIRSKA